MFIMMTSAEFMGVIIILGGLCHVSIISFIILDLVSFQ